MSVQGRKIQTKKSKKQDLEETANKLRAIKERQGQWMRERNEAKASQSTSSLKSLESSRSKTSSTRSSSISDMASNVEPRRPYKDPYSNPRRKPLYEAPKKDHSNIITWSGKNDSSSKVGRPSSAQRKQPSSAKLSTNSYSKPHTLNERSPYQPSNYTSVKDTPSKETDTPSISEKLQPISSGVLEGEKSKDDFDKFGVQDDIKRDEFDYRDYATTYNETRGSFKKAKEKPVANLAQEMNADVINALAETVARKLKNNIGTGHVLNHSKASDKEEEQEMSTHKCPLCQSLMSGTRHTPIALIPCGHTFCKSCATDCKKCPSCQSLVSTSAVNTVLQHIITDFLAQKEQKRLEKMENETRKYVDEYQSLSLRSNALAEEADVILNGMEDITEKLFQEKKIFKRLQVDNEDLEKKISELQNQLERNRSKMLESQEQCDNLEGKYEDDKQRLSLVEDTIRTITQSKERVKMLVKNFAPTFNLDQFD